MKKIILFTSILALILVFSACEKDLFEEPILDLKSANKGNDKLTGFDQWGYNWNAHQFNGYLINAWLGDNMDTTANWYKAKPPYNGGDIDEFKATLEAANDDYDVEEWFFLGYGDMTLVMHWNESMISREGAYPEDIKDTDAWITFHYRAGEGKDKWSQFQKFVAVKSTDVLETGYDPETDETVYGWFSQDGEYIGKYYMWPDRALVQVVNTGNVPFGMLDTYKGPLFGPGLGKYKNR